MTTLSKYIIILFLTLTLIACGGPTYKLIYSSSSNDIGREFNVKHVLDCCGCSGVLVNTFQHDKLQSQLFIESKGCPFNWTKYMFYYSNKGVLSRVDTLIAVTDNSFTYPITEVDKIALGKVDSFIVTRNSTSYPLRQIEIKGYRDKTEADNQKLMLLPPRLDKHAIH